MVTRPLMDSIASITRPSWRNGVGSTHWLRQAKRTIMSGMGGCSSCRLDWGIHSLHGARSPCLMWVDDAVGLSHLRFGEGIVKVGRFCVRWGFLNFAKKEASMLGEVFERFVEKSRMSVMVRA